MSKKKKENKWAKYVDEWREAILPFVIILEQIYLWAKGFYDYYSKNDPKLDFESVFDKLFTLVDDMIKKQYMEELTTYEKSLEIFPPIPKIKKKEEKEERYIG